MLATARQSVARAGLSDVIALRQADATGFDPLTLFGRAGFDRIVISYALSMIPPWQAVIEEAARRLVPGGELHIVDFGDQTGLPAPFRAVLRRGLALFQVTPRGELGAVLDEAARDMGATVRADALYRGYATLARLRRAA
jgi:S-adenosylmethionine-diacylgycerolhomoserine-N-methlytransferase